MLLLKGRVAAVRVVGSVMRSSPARAARRRPRTRCCRPRPARDLAEGDDPVGAVGYLLGLQRLFDGEVGCPSLLEPFPGPAQVTEEDIRRPVAPEDDLEQQIVAVRSKGVGLAGQPLAQGYPALVGELEGAERPDA